MTSASSEAKLRNFLLKAGFVNLIERIGLVGPLGATWNFIRRPKHLMDQIDILKDYHSFKQSCSFLAEGSRLASPEKKVLVVSLTDWVAQVKMESILAKALQLHGYTPVIVTNKSCKHAVKYFKVFGYDKFVFLDELLGGIPLRPVITEAQAILNDSPSFHSLLDLKYHGVDVGRHVLSSIVRTLRHGSFEFANPQAMDLLRRWFPRSMQLALAAELIFDRVKPQMVLFLEKGYTPYGEFFDVALNRGVNTIQFLHSHRSDALILKRYTQKNRHMHPFSLSPESMKLIEKMPWSAQRESELMQELKGRYEEGTWFNRKYLQVGKKLKDAAEVREQLGLDPGKKTVVIFSHVLWDATFFFGENLFEDYEQWLIETVKAASSNPAVNWVIKIHPDYVWKMKQLGDSAGPRDLIALGAEIGELPKHIKILMPETDISTFSLFDVTDYCVTVRGTIGIEMPCFGIPVFTAGTGRYSGLGFTMDSNSRDEYLTKLRRIQDFPRLTKEQTLLARKHAYTLFKVRPLVFKTFEMVQMPLKSLGHPLDNNLVIRGNSFQDVANAPDLETFADWATNSNQPDFLMPFADDV
jgi:hypothetical protein